MPKGMNVVYYYDKFKIYEELKFLFNKQEL